VSFVTPLNQANHYCRVLLNPPYIKRPAKGVLMTSRTNLTAAIALLLLAEATLFFTFLFTVGPIGTLERLLPLAMVVVLGAALYWGRGQDWVQWGLLVPVAFRVWKVVPLVAAAWGLGRTGTALFLTFIMLAELFAVFILLDSYFVRRQRPSVMSAAGAKGLP
jgi:hypothetical protein